MLTKLGSEDDLARYAHILPNATKPREFLHAAFVGVPKGCRGLAKGQVSINIIVDYEYREEALKVFDSVDVPVKVIIQKWNGEKVD